MILELGMLDEVAALPGVGRPSRGITASPSSTSAVVHAAIDTSASTITRVAGGSDRGRVVEQLIDEEGDHTGDGGEEDAGLRVRDADFVAALVE